MKRYCVFRRNVLFENVCYDDEERKTKHKHKNEKKRYENPRIIIIIIKIMITRMAVDDAPSRIPMLVANVAKSMTD